jgi:Tol biopolymer transport system component
MLDRSRVASVAIGTVLALALMGCSGSGSHSPSATSSVPAPKGHLAWGWEKADGVIVYTSNADGSEAKPLGAAQHGEQPHWSPDGSRLAIVTSAGSDIVGSVVKADGTGRTVFSLPSGAPNLACAVWSPDSQRLACEGFNDGKLSLDGVYTVASTNGKDLTRLTQGPDVPCSYSPDGTKVLFIRHDGPDEEHSSLMTVTVGGRHQTNNVIASQVGLSCDWSPNGKTILSELDGSLLLINAVSGAIRTLKIPVRSGRGAFSPDGTHIIFSRGTGDHQSDIWTVKTDGTDLRRITKTEGTDNDEEFGDWGR